MPTSSREDFVNGLLEYGASLPKKKRVEGPYPVVGSNGVTGYHSEYLVEGPAIIVGRKGSAGEVTLIDKNVLPNRHYLLC